MEIENKLDKKRLIRYIIYEIIFSFIFILTLVSRDRLNSFSDVFGSMFNLKNIGIILFYTSLVLAFLYYTVMLLRYVLTKDKKTDKIDKKLDIPLFIIKCITFIMFVMIFITTPCTVVGESMYPTFESGDKLLSFNICNGFKRNDIIIFDAEDYTNDSSFYIKRVVAKEGDIISYDIEEETFYINDNIEDGVSASQFINIRESIGIDSGNSFKIPKNKLVVFGDNRGNSLDSRTFGVIDESSVFGRIYFSLIPFKTI